MGEYQTALLSLTNEMGFNALHGLVIHLNLTRPSAKMTRAFGLLAWFIDSHHGKQVLDGPVFVVSF